MKVKHTQVSADDRLTVAAAARIVGVHPQTLRDYEKAGRIESSRTPGGHRRYIREDVEALAAGSSPTTGEQPAPASKRVAS
ncbi:MerR family DNA-binding transcriptional regulator [Brevibacterium sp. H-BE7]|uniref:MerR family DNA-binding transcriptional regulator n=1 Tax=unclassified Brevibacterium TaxID=2614124 RepID=UPI0033070FEE|nr:MerR family DNA-binding transcriptional regulator [Brevibacterium sp. CCUG 69071]